MRNATRHIHKPGYETHLTERLKNLNAYYEKYSEEAKAKDEELKAKDEESKDFALEL